MNIILATLLIIFAYLLGSLASAIFICKAFKLPDPRTIGSHNPGATNVLRSGNRYAAILTLLADVLKGVIPVLLAKLLGLSPAIIALVALAVTLGHIYPVFFGFKGGKGVATAFGAILALSWPVALLLLGTWIVIAALFRYSSLAAIITCALLPLYIWFLSNKSYLVPIVILAVLIIIKHKANIIRLLNSEETKIGYKIKS